ncbi:MAG TPA: hypothetical protein VHE30_09395 [Polyangiaceae bacterium]|nr:hypothetical protein [Polyangiaceae bacterium]
MRLLPCFVLAVGLSACAPGPEVVRLSNGRDVSGRFVSEEAYAEFLSGTVAEAAGDLRTAAERYRATLDADGGAAEAWARLGVVLCRSAPHEADRALSRAERAAPDLAAPFLADAECALVRGDGARALAAATRALARAPDDPECTRVVASSLERLGRSDEARRIRRAAELRADTGPLRPEPRGALIDESAPRDGSLGPPAPGPRRTTEGIVLEKIRLGRAADAVRAASLGLVSDPGDSTLAALALSSADLAGDDASFQRFLRRLPADRVAPSEAALAELEALIARRLGESAANAFRRARRPRAR